MKKLLAMTFMASFALSGCGSNSIDFTCQAISTSSMVTVTNKEQDEIAALLKLEILAGTPRYSDKYGNQDTKSEIKFKFKLLNDPKSMLPVSFSDNKLIEKNFDDFKKIKLIDRSSGEQLEYAINNKDDAQSHIYDFIKFNRGTGNIEIMFSESKYDGQNFAFVKRTYIKGNCNKAS